MRIVIDANILISMLVKPGKPFDVFFNIGLDIHAPKLLFEEIESNRQEILEKTNLTEEQFNLLYLILKHNIKLVPEKDFLKFREEADKICPDPKDIVYFALALYLKSSIWTNEKKLKEQDKVKIYPTHELMKLVLE